MVIHCQEKNLNIIILKKHIIIVFEKTFLKLYNIHRMIK